MSGGVSEVSGQGSGARGSRVGRVSGTEASIRESCRLADEVEIVAGDARRDSI